MSWQRRFFALALLLASLLIGLSSPDAASARSHGHLVTVSATKQGLVVTMSVRSGPYPRGAKVPVTWRLRNRSSGARVLWIANCHGPPYGVQVLNQSGRVVYPPPPVRSPGIGCVADNMAPALGPHMSEVRHDRVVLRGPLIRVLISYGVPQSSGDTHVILSTRAVRVGKF